jgi:hypothetical protein
VLRDGSPRTVRPTFALLTALFLAATLRAVAPNLASVTPAGGQRGTTVEVTLRGERLADTQEIFFYDRGITVERIVEAKEKDVKLALVIAPDCRLGEHVLRLRTASGISAMRLFFVGPFPSIDEKEPNNSAAKPQKIPLNSTIHGTILAEDVDVFAVTLKQGERLSAEIEGARLGRTLFDPILTVRDSNGKILAESDDSPLLGHDGFVSLLAPADGAYTIELRDVVYSGNNHAYRLHVGGFPRPAVAFPLGGKIGETLATKFIGDPAGEFAQSIALPLAPVYPRFGFAAKRDGLASPSANWLRVVDFPNAPVVDTASTRAKAPVADATVPFAFNGVLATKGEPAFFRFKAKKDQQLDVTVFARRLGSPLDSVLTVLDAKGASLGNNDDAAGMPDSTVRVKIPADGEFVVKVADMLGRGGERFVYRVEITEVHPSVVLSIPDTARYDYETRKSLAVPRGNRFAVLVNTTRDAFNGDLRVAFEGLPAGITARSDTVPGSLSAVPVVFEAAADAPIAGALLTPTAQPTDPEKAPRFTSRYRHTVDWVRIQNDTMYSRSEVAQIAAGVVEEVPFKISITEPHVPLVQSGEMDLQIVAERAEGFDEPITVKMLWNPPGVTSQSDITIAKSATTAIYKLNANNKAELHKWKIAVVAGATVKGGTAYVSSQLAELEVAAPFVAGKINLAKLERGEKGRLVCALEQKLAFEGTATAQLIGLPSGVTADPVDITKDAKEAVFELVTTAKSPLGLFKNISCKVVVVQNGEPIAHLIAPGSMLRVDAAKTKPAATTAAVTKN